MRLFFAHVLQSSIASLLITVCVLQLFGVADAAVSTSTNYRIERDSINVGGGYGSSSSYTLESTVGEVATGRATSTNYQLQAGYQQADDVYISVAAVGDVVMSGSISGLTGGTANGSTTVTVTTNNNAGYQLQIAAENAPAMQRVGGGDTIADYVPVGGADYVFTTDPGEAHLAFSPEGVDTAAAFLDNGSACGSGSDTSNTCWDGLSTVAATIATRNTANLPSGTATVLQFRVGVASGASLLQGAYVATSTVTALPL